MAGGGNRSAGMLAERRATTSTSPLVANVWPREVRELLDDSWRKDGYGAFGGLVYTYDRPELERRASRLCGNGDAEGFPRRQARLC